MFKYRVYGKGDGANRPTMIAATDFRDVAFYIKNNISQAFGVDGDKRLEITIAESKDADFFTRYRKNDPTEVDRYIVPRGESEEK